MIDLAQCNSRSLLLFAEGETNNQFTTGYYTLDLQSGQITLVKALEQNNNTKAAPNSLIYSGKFTTTDSGTVCYYCDKYPKLYFFDTASRFLYEFTTADNTPKAELVSNGAAYFYKRGSAYNVNNGVMFNKDTLLVFSCRTKPISEVMVDYYSIPNRAYLFSTKIAHNNWNSWDVISITKSSNNTAIANFQKGTILLNFGTPNQ